MAYYHFHWVAPNCSVKLDCVKGFLFIFPQCVFGPKIITQIVCPGEDNSRRRWIEGEVKGEDEGGSHWASDHGWPAVSQEDV